MDDKQKLIRIRDIAEHALMHDVSDFPDHVAEFDAVIESTKIDLGLEAVRHILLGEGSQ